MVNKIITELKAHGNTEKAKSHSRFFKTAEGEYGEGDKFIGVSVPEQRMIVKQYAESVNLDDIEQLVIHTYHECRMTGFLLLVSWYKRSKKEEEQRALVLFYLAHVTYLNNWDLVDVTCCKILGPWLEKRDRTVLYVLADSDHLWSQRLAIITTMHFIKQDDFADTLRLADILLHHRHDLIHKAVGWMLREVGKRDPACEREFLQNRYTRMPRTMLRYAIEKFPEQERRSYLHGRI